MKGKCRGHEAAILTLKGAVTKTWGEVSSQTMHFLSPYITCYNIKLAKNIHKNGTKVARLHLCLSSFV
ncbi:hypothetical protein C0J52_02664 [Blattella germanica]|nr:hypothetical protein C0J52_02664 [Blattella germanica]